MAGECARPHGRSSDVRLGKSRTSPDSAARREGASPTRGPYRLRLRTSHGRAHGPHAPSPRTRVSAARPQVAGNHLTNHKPTRTRHSPWRRGILPVGRLRFGWLSATLCATSIQMIVFDQRNRSSSVTTLCTLPEYLLRFTPNDVIMTTRTPFRVRV